MYICDCMNQHSSQIHSHLQHTSTVGYSTVCTNTRVHVLVIPCFCWVHGNTLSVRKRYHFALPTLLPNTKHVPM